MRVREGSGTMRSRVWPIASSAGYPKSASAPLFHRRITPAQSAKMIASGAHAISAASGMAVFTQVTSAMNGRKKAGDSPLVSDTFHRTVMRLQPRSLRLSMPVKELARRPP